MATFSRAPRLRRGAIVGVDMFNPVASVILFQYNPHTLTRTLNANRVGNEGAPGGQHMRLNGAPRETISLDVEIDATDQLEAEQPTAVQMGIYPQLSALEMLLYPKSSLVIANTALLAAGTIEVIPPVGPLTLFIWGPKRILPVILTDFSVTEEAHDPNLNPIRATVSLGLQVLTYNDLSLTHPGYYVFLAHQVVKETMATISSMSNVPAANSGGGTNDTMAGVGSVKNLTSVGYGLVQEAVSQHTTPPPPPGQPDQEP